MKNLYIIIYMLVAKLYINTVLKWTSKFFNYYYEKKYNNQRVIDLTKAIMLVNIESIEHIKKRSEMLEIFTRGFMGAYRYSSDKFFGALNWTWDLKNKPKAAAWCELRGDCEKYASLAQYAFRGANRICILPLNPFKLHKAHTIYSDSINGENYIFSSGNVFKMRLFDYLNYYSKTKNIDCFSFYMNDGFANEFKRIH